MSRLCGPETEPRHGHGRAEQQCADSKHARRRLCLLPQRDEHRGHDGEHPQDQNELRQRRHHESPPNPRSVRYGLDQRDQSRAVDVEDVAILGLEEQALIRFAQPPPDDLPPPERREVRDVRRRRARAQPRARQRDRESRFDDQWAAEEHTRWTSSAHHSSRLPWRGERSSHHTARSSQQTGLVAGASSA